MSLVRTLWSTSSVALAAAALLTAQVYAQEAAPEAASGPVPQAAAASSQQAEPAGLVEEVIVRGQRMSEIEFDIRDYIRDFIGEVVALPPGGGFARWHTNVCIGVHNLEKSSAQYVVDRISYLAQDVGLAPGEPGCSPDVVIIFTTDANQLATDLVENEPRMFRPGGGVCCMQLGLEALDNFVESDAAVRWWHVSMPVDALMGQRAIRLPQDDTYPVISVAGPSRIHRGTRDDMYRVIIIVDGTKLAGTTWQQIGDYLAVVSLAQVQPSTDPTAADPTS